MLKYPEFTRWGTDPEAFFRQRGEILGSEKFIPADGVKLSGGNTIVRDGVQFELNPQSGTVAQLASNISDQFRRLREITRMVPDLTICFDGLVEVSKKELDSLSPATRVLGCMPSSNLYGIKPIKVDPKTYRKRSSGGHIHVGLTPPIFNRLTSNPDERTRLVPLMDIFVGTATTLIDRDPGAAERRENYGRAGEYRLPKHGLEYRTTSNFWLRNYALMDFTFGMAAIAVSILTQSLSGSDIEQELIDVVDIKRVAKAIDKSDYELALSNFQLVVPFLRKHLPRTGFPLTPQNIDKFLTFAEGVQINGIEHYFPTEQIVDTWCDLPFEPFAAFLERV